MSNKDKPLFDKKVLLKKMSGKGGWTYAELPEVKQDKSKPFGWVSVKGTIDDYAFKQFKLMPMGNGKLFFSVKASIRKAIEKEEGDYVHIKLFSDDSKTKIPEELIECFEFEPKDVFATFKSFGDGQQKAYIDWVYESKSEETKARRILKMMNKLKLGLKLHQKE